MEVGDLGLTVKNWTLGYLPNLVLRSPPSTAKKFQISNCQVLGQHPRAGVKQKFLHPTFTQNTKLFLSGNWGNARNVKVLHPKCSFSEKTARHS